MGEMEQGTTPYLIRGSKGIPVGVVPHVPTAYSGPIRGLPVTLHTSPRPSERIEYNVVSNRSKKSSVMKATAVRKTATMKKKKGPGASTLNNKALEGTLFTGDDNTWRPLGAFMENPMGSSVNHQSFMNPPRLSQEVHPVNLQGLFDDANARDKKIEAPRRLQVFVRIRPWSVSEESRKMGHPVCMHMTSPETLALAPPLGSLAYKHGECQKGQTFTFSQIFGPRTSQADYFSFTADAMVESLIQTDQGEGVYLSYGITNAGKTFTIQGTKDNPGIVPLALKSIFQKIDPLSHSVEVSFCEIYNELIFDLLKEKDGMSLKLADGKDGQVHVAGLSWHTVENTKDAWTTLRKGIRQRRKAETKLNYSSSRSHSIFSIQLKRKNGPHSRISFVDLAGSERVGRTGNSGARFKETVSINSSLMTLGRCLESLRYNQQALKKNIPLKVIPYRESKVTHLFRDALHGHGRVVLSVNVSPSPDDFDETLRVLKYAMVASHISSSCPVQPPKRKLRAETPIGLRRHRLRMEQSRAPLSREKSACESGAMAGTTVVHNVGQEQSVSIDSRIQEVSQVSPSPLVLKEEEINGNMLVSIREEESISFNHQDSGDNFSSEKSGDSPTSSKAHDITPNCISRDETLQSEVERLQKQLESAEKKLVDIEAEVREEVATEMTQIIDNIEKKYKQRLEVESISAREKLEILEKDHKEEMDNLNSKVASQQMELENVQSAIQELRDEAKQTHKTLVESNEEVERYKKALNDALSEIERLHIVIEQEEAANAKLAASLSDILKEQSPAISLDAMTPESDVRLKYKRFKQEVTQIEANKAMEQEMSDHLIDRLKKDNEMLRNKMSAIMNAIELSSSPSKKAIMQNLLVTCPSGMGKGAGGTPHDVALARARRACTEDSENSPKSSRFAREVALTQEENQHVEDALTPSTENAKDENIDSSTKSRPRRSSPRKNKGLRNIKDSEKPLEDEPSRITRGKTRDKIEEVALAQLDGPICTPSDVNGTTSKVKSKRKLLSTSKPKSSKSHTGSTKILGVSNSSRKTRRALPSASDLGFTA